MNHVILHKHHFWMRLLLEALFTTAHLSTGSQHYKYKLYTLYRKGHKVSIKLKHQLPTCTAFTTISLALELECLRLPFIFWSM